MEHRPSEVLLTEFLAALSLGTDLGMGHPMEHVLRQSFLALRLGERLGLDASTKQVLVAFLVIRCHDAAAGSRSCQTVRSRKGFAMVAARSYEPAPTSCDGVLADRLDVPPTRHCRVR